MSRSGSTEVHPWASKLSLHSRHTKSGSLHFEEVEELQQELDDLRHFKETMTEQIADAEENLSQQTENNLLLSQELEQAETEKQHMAQRMEVLELTIADLRTDNASLKTLNQMLSVTLSGVKDVTADELVERMEVTTVAESDVFKLVDEMRGQMSEMDTILSAEKSANIELKCDLKSTETQLLTLQSRFDEAQKDLESKTHFISDLEDELAVVIDQNEILELQIQDVVLSESQSETKAHRRAKTTRLALFSPETNPTMFFSKQTATTEPSLFSPESGAVQMQDLSLLAKTGGDKAHSRRVTFGSGDWGMTQVMHVSEHRKLLESAQRTHDKELKALLCAAEDLRKARCQVKELGNENQRLRGKVKELTAELALNASEFEKERVFYGKRIEQLSTEIKQLNSEQRMAMETLLLSHTNHVTAEQNQCCFWCCSWKR